MSEPARRRPGTGDRLPAERLDQPLAKRRRWVPQRRMDPESFGAFAERADRLVQRRRALGGEGVELAVRVLPGVDLVLAGEAPHHLPAPMVGALRAPGRAVLAHAGRGH